MRTDSGQAMAEFIIGIFTLTLILSAFLAFAHIIPKAVENIHLVRHDAGLNAQNGVSGGGAAGAGESMPIAQSILAEGGAPYISTPTAESIRRFETDVGEFAEQHLFGRRRVTMEESAYIPMMNIPKPARSIEE